MTNTSNHSNPLGDQWKCLPLSQGRTSIILLRKLVLRPTEGSALITDAVSVIKVLGQHQGYWDLTPDDLTLIDNEYLTNYQYNWSRSYGDQHDFIYTQWFRDIRNLWRPCHRYRQRSCENLPSTDQLICTYSSSRHRETQGHEYLDEISIPWIKTKVHWWVKTV